MWQQNNDKPLYTFTIKRRLKGFTLIELMIVVFVVSIIAAIAYPSYQAQIRRAAESLAQQEMLKIAEQLERHRNKNFTYKDFDPKYMYGETSDMVEITLPRGKTGNAIKYNLTIRDSGDTSKLLTEIDENGGRGWAIMASSSDNRNYNLLLTSKGIRCKNKSNELVTYEGCGSASAGSKTW